MEQTELPAGWRWATIGEIAETTSGGTPSRANDAYFDGTIPWIKSGELNDSIVTSAEEYITDDALHYSNAKIIPKGTPLIALYGATVGRTGILGIDAATNQAVCAMLLHPSKCTPKFLVLWLQSQRDNLVALSAGGAQRNISQGIVKTYPIPLPSVPDQQRIVEYIETQFTRLDAAVAALKRVRANLRRYRAAVLKAACAGQLVPTEAELARAAGRGYEPAAALLARMLAERRAQWQAEHPGKQYKEPAGPDTSALPELPEGWCWASVKQLGEVQLGRQRAPQHHSGPHMRPYLRVANVYEDRIDTSDVFEMNFTPAEYETFKLQYGDILLNEGQSPEFLGRPAMYRDEVPGACFQNTLIRFRAYPGVVPEYALSVFRHYMHAGRFQKIGQITTNIAHLSAGRFAEVEFPLPPFTEQERIVNELGSRLSQSNQTATAIAQNEQRAARLRQSILQRAFRGELTSGAQDDELPTQQLSLELL